MSVNAIKFFDKFYSEIYKDDYICTEIEHEHNKKLNVRIYYKGGHGDTFIDTNFYDITHLESFYNNYALHKLLHFDIYFTKTYEEELDRIYSMRRNPTQFLNELIKLDEKLQQFNI